MSDPICPFCPPPTERVFHTGELVLGLWDAFPVSPGHALLVPRRHVAAWWEATPEDQQELLGALDVAREEILKRHQPDGFNVGWNVGAAAGQTVFHLHVHVIPRYAGDVADPRGGVRHVIPAKANYLAQTDLPATLPELPHQQAIILGEDPFLPHLRASLCWAWDADLAVAFGLESGVRGVIEHLRDLLVRGGRLRLVTGDYLGVTEPDALTHLLDLEGDVHLRVYEAGGGSFHPKRLPLPPARRRRHRLRRQLQPQHHRAGRRRGVELPRDLVPRRRRPRRHRGRLRGPLPPPANPSPVELRRLALAGRGISALRRHGPCRSGETA